MALFFFIIKKRKHYTSVCVYITKTGKSIQYEIEIDIDSE